MTDLKNNYLMNRNRILNDGKVNQQNKPQKTQPQNNGKSFAEILDKVKSSDEVKFSKHAIQRLKQRNIELSDTEVGQIKDALVKAEKKGVKDALIMMNDKVFVANVKSKTIITASTDDQLKDNVFTNIDGAVIV